MPAAAELDAAAEGVEVARTSANSASKLGRAPAIPEQSHDRLPFGLTHGDEIRHEAVAGKAPHRFADSGRSRVAPRRR